MFGSKSQLSFSVDNDHFTFDKLKSTLNATYNIDFIDNEIIKFHTDWSLKQWQLGCFVEWDKSSSIVTVHCFPFSGGFTTKSTFRTTEFCEKLKSEILG